MKIPKKLLNHIESELKCKIFKHEAIGSGAHNLNYVLETNSGKFVLRVYANFQFDNAKGEFRILKRLNGHLAPKAFLLDASKKYIKYNYMVQEFVSGKPINKLSNKMIIKISKLLKEVHSITEENKERPLKKHISKWAKSNILEKSICLGEEFHKSMIMLYKNVLERLEKCNPLLKKYKRFHLIHEDPVLENFLVQDEKIVLIDWELAMYDYFFKDFGTFIAENHITKKQENLFLKECGFGQTLEEKKLVQYAKISRIFSSIAWLIERIAAIKEKRQIFIHDNPKKHKIHLEKEIRYIHNLLDEQII